MARRSGRKGAWLATDDYTGFTRYSSQLKQDFWGSYAQNPLKRNLQEIAVGLDDPRPVPFFRGSNYEVTNGCIAEVSPPNVGVTSIPTNSNNMATQVLNLSPGIGEMAVGCSFIVR
jgi:hypothetical protein